MKTQTKSHTHPSLPLIGVLLSSLFLVACGGGSSSAEGSSDATVKFGQPQTVATTEDGGALSQALNVTNLKLATITRKP